MSEQVARNSTSNPGPRRGWNNLPGGNPGWKKGQSGNPKGRPKAPEDIAALCRVHTAEAVNVLVKAMKRERDAVPAAIALLDRGWGKPKQQLEVSADADAIGLHLVAARAFVALAEAAEAGQAQPPTIDGEADRAEARARSLFALDAPKPTE
jgi:hypothetical protein